MSLCVTFSFFGVLELLFDGPLFVWVDDCVFFVIVRVSCLASTTSVTNPTSQSSSSQNNKQEETKTEQKVERCTNNNNHGMNIGNSGKWFNSKNDAIAYYNQQIKYWGDQWENNKIDNDTYYKNCPSGYEVWDCMYNFLF